VRSAQPEWIDMQLKPLQIGSLVIEFPVILAPMAGYTDLAMRLLSREHGAGMVMTEVVNAQGINHGSKRTLHMLESCDAERPVGGHIYGREPEDMARAAATIEGLGRFDFIDINCGCPVRKIVAKGCGAALMAEPDRVGRIVAAVSEAVSLPVTVKTRIGLTPDRLNVDDVAQAVEENGGGAIAIHGRFACNRHKGPADWETIARIKSARAIPVVGNGGVDTPADVERMFRETGVDGGMVGRVAVGNPWFFDHVKRLAAGQPVKGCSPAERRSAIVRHLELMKGLKEKERQYRRSSCLEADPATALHFRGHLHQYLAGLQGWATVRRRLQEIHSLADVMAGVDYVLEQEQRAESV
jgi:tRNA-dihydrouridine synthase B